MTTIKRRIAALSGAGFLVATASAVAILGATAHAASTDPYVAVAWYDPTQGTDFLLNAQATYDVNHDESRASPVCGQGITAAVQAGLPVPDQARQVCVSAVLACVRDAVRVRGNALSGVRFYSGRSAGYPAGTYKCLVR
jgi:hypothetical protein